MTQPKSARCTRCSSKLVTRTGAELPADLDALCRPCAAEVPWMTLPVFHRAQSCRASAA